MILGKESKGKIIMEKKQHSEVFWSNINHYVNAL
jgi:hypothetical protein